MVKVGNRNFTKISQWQVDYIKENYQDKVQDIADKINLDYRRVLEIIKLLGLKRDRYWKVYLPKTKEVEEKLKNPYLSHIEIAKEYGVTDTCVAKRRKELGVGVRRKNFDTLIEKEVASLLEELDLVFSSQKRIEQWSIDFYLGRRYCIDVHGEWAHQKPIVKDRDKRKTHYLQENGYHYLVILEEELSDIEKVKNKIKEFTQGFPQQ